jgi:hypothetical protein
MLVNNIISEEAVQMIVPKLDDPKVIELDEGNRLTINIVPEEYDGDRYELDDKLAVSGFSDRVRLGSQLEFTFENLHEMVSHLEDAVKKNPKVEIILRADAATHYEIVQPVMEAITGAGISRVNLMAFLPNEGPDMRGKDN